MLSKGAIPKHIKIVCKNNTKEAQHAVKRGNKFSTVEKMKNTYIRGISE